MVQKVEPQKNCTVCGKPECQMGLCLQQRNHDTRLGDICPGARFSDAECHGCPHKSPEKRCEECGKEKCKHGGSCIWDHSLCHGHTTTKDEKRCGECNWTLTIDTKSCHNPACSPKEASGNLGYSFSGVIKGTSDMPEAVSELKDSKDCDCHAASLKEEAGKEEQPKRDELGHFPGCNKYGCEATLCRKFP